MIKRILVYLMALVMASLPLAAAEDTKEADRLENCGTVLKEILDIPDDIPQDLLDKAECVRYIPLGAESCVRDRRQLRPRRDDLPHGRALHRSVERANDDGARGRQRRIPDRRAGDRLRSSGDERARGTLDS